MKITEDIEKKEDITKLFRLKKEQNDTAMKDKKYF